MEQSPDASANEDTQCGAGRRPSCAELAAGDRYYSTCRESLLRVGESVGLAGADRIGAARCRCAQRLDGIGGRGGSLGGRCGRTRHSAAPLRFVAHTLCGCPRRRPRLRRDLLRLQPPRRPTSVGAVHVGTQRCEGTRVLVEYGEYRRHRWRACAAAQRSACAASTASCASVHRRARPLVGCQRRRAAHTTRTPPPVPHTWAARACARACARA